MNFPWALCIAREDAAVLAGLRLVPGIEVAENTPKVWLRGSAADESLSHRLLALPTTERYERLPSGRLRRLNERIPSHQLPELAWQPLAAWLHAAIPIGAMPGDAPTPVALQLTRSAGEQKPELLLTDLVEFQRFVEQAALVRLRRWQFAANADGRVLIRGTPLPPLPGKQFVVREGVATPAGFDWCPAVDAEVVARCFGASDEGLVLWQEDGSIIRLHREQFMPVTRSAVAATQQALSEGVPHES